MNAEHERTAGEQAAWDLEFARQRLTSDMVRRSVDLCLSSWVDSVINGSDGKRFDEDAHDHYYGLQSPDWDDIRDACEDEAIYVVEWLDDDARTFQDADGDPFDLIARGGMSEEDAAELRDDAAAGNVAGWYVFESGTLYGNGRIDAFDDCEEATRAAADRANLEPSDYTREIYEWWAVDRWFGERLSARGEHVVTGEHGGSVWGRTCTGQGIASDEVVRSIAAETWPEEWSGAKAVES